MTTQYANASYQEVIDLHTESDSVSVIGIHTPISDTPHKMMKGFFEQFKKFKYAGCSVSLVPAARLPADPLQVSYEAGETTIDPRDMLNPLMFHGCHGNDLGMVLNRLYNLNSGNSLGSDSVNLHQGNVIQSDFVESDLILDGQELENLYYKALTDNTWKKAHPQRGFRKSGLHPMIYGLATTQQIMNESLIAAPTSPYNIGLTRGVPSPAEFDYDTVSNPAEWSVDVPINRQFKLMTPRIQKLGWLDTKQVLTNAGTVEGTFDTTGMSESEVREALSEAFTGALNGIVESQEVYATLPKIYMGVILMPPAYKTEQYFRMIITHHFEFKNFRGISFANDIHESPCYDNWNEDISLGSGGDTGGDTGGEVDPPNPDVPDDPGEGGGDGVVINQLSSRSSSSISDVNQMAWEVIDVDIEDVNIQSKLGYSNPNYRYVFALVDSDMKLINPVSSGTVSNASVCILQRPINSNSAYAYINENWYPVAPSVSDATKLQIYVNQPEELTVYWTATNNFLDYVDDVCTTDVVQSIAVVIS